MPGGRLGGGQGADTCPPHALPLPDHRSYTNTRTHTRPTWYAELLAGGRAQMRARPMLCAPTSALQSGHSDSVRQARAGVMMTV